MNVESMGLILQLEKCVMTATRLLEMAAVIHVKLKLDGSAQRSKLLILSARAFVEMD